MHSKVVKHPTKNIWEMLRIFNPINSFYLITLWFSDKNFPINGPGAMPLIVFSKLSNLGKQVAPVAGKVFIDVNSLCIMEIVV